MNKLEIQGLNIFPMKENFLKPSIPLSFMEYKKGLIFILILAAIAINIFFIYTENSGGTFCLTGQGCKIVQSSEYATLLGDIKNSHLGIFAFAYLIVIYTLTYKRKISYMVFLISTYLGAILALLFLYLQAFVIGAYCSNCVAIDIIMILMAIVATLDYKETK